MATPSASSSTAPTQPAPPAWTDPLLQSPHTVKDKARRVNEMFSAIAPSYDLNNRLHSLWMDQHWRNVAVKMAAVKDSDRILDVACGTGDLTLKFAEVLNHRSCLKPNQVIGLDFTFEMLPIAVRKSGDHAISKEIVRERERSQKEEYDRMAAQGVLVSFNLDDATMRDEVPFVNGDAMALPFPNASMDVLSIAFGIRNVSDWGAAIDEFTRVLKPGGRLIILEFSLPTNFVLRAFYNFYFKKIMPITATLISGDKSGAYKYLPQSVNTFISRQAMQDRMKAAGLVDVIARPMTFGICVCYKGVRP